MTLPSGWTTFTVSVDAIKGTNVKISILEDASCDQPENVCVDDAGAGECEIAQATAGTGQVYGNAAYVVVHSDYFGDITTRFRAD